LTVGRRILERLFLHGSIRMDRKTSIAYRGRECNEFVMGNNLEGLKAGLREAATQQRRGWLQHLHRAKSHPGTHWDPLGVLRTIRPSHAALGFLAIKCRLKSRSSVLPYVHELQCCNSQI